MRVYDNMDRTARTRGGTMLNTIWAIVRDGKIVPLEKVQLPDGCRLLLTVLADGDEEQFWLPVSQECLAAVWDNDEDDVYAELLSE